MTFETKAALLAALAAGEKIPVPKDFGFVVVQGDGWSAKCQAKHGFIATAK